MNLSFSLFRLKNWILWLGKSIILKVSVVVLINHHEHTVDLFSGQIQSEHLLITPKLIEELLYEGLLKIRCISRLILIRALALEIERTLSFLRICLLSLTYWRWIALMVLVQRRLKFRRI